jgi:uncharacterized protein with von Willebrand factor type A (vWA) domain
MPQQADPVSRLVGFGRYLRRRGFPVGTGRILTYCRAAAVLEPLDREDLYWAGRATLVSGRDAIERYDDAFRDYFGGSELAGSEPSGSPGLPDQPDVEAVELGPVASAWAPAEEGDETEGEASLRVVASEVEVLRRKSFEELSEEERRRTTALIRALAVQAPVRPARRFRRAESGARLDLRRTLRRSLQTEGVPFSRAWKARGTRLRPLTLLLDVSGSMGAYSRSLIQFAFAAMAAGGRVEVFCFGTRLTRVTPVLKSRSPDRALRDVARAVTDWEGGTRIGDSLKELLDRWGQRTGLRGAVVVLCSDGLERGDPDVLRAQMARLSRLARRVVWVNPLSGSPRYEPLARGMAAALPFVDVFIPGHNVEAIETLAEVLGDGDIQRCR